MLRPLRLDLDSLSGSPPEIATSLIKSHIRVDFSDDDTLLYAFRDAAIRWAEDATHRTIFNRAHRWVLAQFPDTLRQEIRLPRGKTTSVTSIQYYLAGSLTTLTGPTSSVAGTDYQEDLRGEDGGVLMPPRGSSWPSADEDVPAPVCINFMAGWESSEVPDPVLHAMLFYIADAYDLRGTPDFMPAMLAAGGPRFEAREAMISPYRLHRWY